MVKLPVFNENDSGAHSSGSAVICRFFWGGRGLGWPFRAAASLIAL